MSVLEGLNEEQREAVCAGDGPLLILAGAGSGKTRVLTHRIAYLIQETGVGSSQILAMTFTNKAAQEMRGRVEALLRRSTRGLWIGTFHSLCARLLRMEAGAAGIQANFSIYDDGDQLALLRRVIRDVEVPADRFPPGRMRARISREKNRMVDPAAVAQVADTFHEQGVARIYRQYQESLRRNNALDFDDLLVLSVQLLQDHPDVREAYQQRFRYILIDEYQDTNRPQYLFAKHLAEHHRNICVVGDDDQSIYAWRGADIRNILDFEVDYPDTRVIRLERNYRSTQVIIDAGNAVIRNNRGRKGKELWTDRRGGEKVRLLRCADEREEALEIVRAVEQLRRDEGYTYGDTALLYRTNAQSRALEDGLRKAGIPYVIVGGLRFYERKEIKDILAYLRTIVNPRDSVSLQRIINTPRRGIGDTSLARLDDYSMREGMAPYEALACLDEIGGISDRTRKALNGFREMMEAFREDAQLVAADRLTAEVVERTGYLTDLGNLSQVEAESRAENVQEFLAGIQEFLERSDDASLEAFLREVSLVTDVDTWEPNSDAVTLMTLHGAKGLEFPVVFIGGLEEGLMPIVRERGDSDDRDDIEEERRLFYVGITRAKERLSLSRALQRRRYGGPLATVDSRFLGEIPEHLVEPDGRTGGRFDMLEQYAYEGSAHPASGVEGDIVREVGAWIDHPELGRGQVQGCSGAGARAKLTIRFEDGTTRKVVARYVQWEEPTD